MDMNVVRELGSALYNKFHCQYIFLKSQALGHDTSVTNKPVVVRVGVLRLQDTHGKQTPCDARFTNAVSYTHLTLPTTPYV